MIKVAILGSGIGKAHLDGYRRLPERFDVKFMCDLDTTRAAAATENDPKIQIVSDIAAVLSDPDIDLVDVCLPPHLHAPVVIKALEAGKNVVCEKPIGRSLAEVALMQAAIEKTGGKVFPVFQYRFGLAFSQLSALMEAGLAGKALVASAETHWNREKPYYDVAWRGTWEGESGGALLGHAIHSHDILSNILGPVAQVAAFTDTRVNDIEVEDCAAVSLRMESGALVTSSVTLGAAPDTSRLKLCFEGLTAESGSNPYAPAEGIWHFTARGATKQEDVDRVLAEVAAPYAGFAGFLDAIADALSDNGGKEVTFEDGRRSIELVTAIYTSAREGRLVQLPIGKEEALYSGWSPA
ncbi:Gfo/Idh/MocA family protein [Phaeobacter sp. B1627]|uniref:Gfo/Idh/MocA family protein n=1 Tax=Phaeobacter sp. B1627 TaxID=2583809 RepID=UPI0011183204|nr:Gfo/Idh/MocA family oxidoreductase [Phaeobacter sp. B1627]TNJ39611.1 Gfo/Idh/MocA family oxidoreductase [Phaeobacter sp. B1627]